MERSGTFFDHRRVVHVRARQRWGDLVGTHDMKDGIITALVVLLSIGYCALCLITLTLLPG